MSKAKRCECCGDWNRATHEVGGLAVCEGHARELSITNGQPVTVLIPRFIEDAAEMARLEAIERHLNNAGRWD